MGQTRSSGVLQYDKQYGTSTAVAIARVLVTNPEIICLDEPLSNLGAKLRVLLREELKEMQAKFGITTVYVTHEQEEA